MTDFAPPIGASATPAPRRTVLVVGVYLVDKPHNAVAIAGELAAARQWQVVQSWAALGGAKVPGALDAVTAVRQREFIPKFAMLNRLLREHQLARYDYILFCDDDIALPAGFVDAYLGLVTAFDLALAQPARTHQSFIDHYFVAQLPGIRGRQTRFVEIGPLFSLRRDIYPELLPFPGESAMGWGYEFVWPCRMEKLGRKMGIIDATPVEHRMRKPVAYYDHQAAAQAMRKYLLTRPHLTPGEAFQIVEAYV